MAVEGESGGGKLVVGGGDLSVSLWLASVVVVMSLFSSSNFFTSNCARLFKLNKNNN